MDDKKDLQKRLRKIEGQIRGLQRMVESDRSCEEILAQFASINGALKAVSLIFLKIYITKCFVDNKDSSSINNIERDMQKILNAFLSTI